MVVEMNRFFDKILLCPNKYLQVESCRNLFIMTNCFLVNGTNFVSALTQHEKFRMNDFCTLVLFARSLMQYLLRFKFLVA